MTDPTLPRADSSTATGFESRAAGASPPRPAASVPAGNGLAWWSDGWRLFVASPWVWIGITLAFVVIMVMLTFIPMLGAIASTLLAPVFAGGVIAGCRALDRGGELTLAHLFAGFHDRLVPLLLVGLLYLAGTIAIMVVVFALLVAVIGIAGIGALMAGDPMHIGFAAMAAMGIGALFAIAVGLLIGLPLMMAYWFAPALVMLRNHQPVGAMKVSFFACLDNVWPMLIYSVIGLLAAIVASVPLFLGWIVLAPIFAASVYASYKDIFGAPAESGPAA